MALISDETQLAKLMVADAKRVHSRTRLWLGGYNLGCAPSNKGQFRPGSRPARLFAAMVPGRAYGRLEAAKMLDISTARAGEALDNLAKAGRIRRMNGPGEKQFVRDA